MATMHDKKHISETDVETVSTDWRKARDAWKGMAEKLQADRDYWRGQAKVAEEQRVFLVTQLEEAVDHGVALEEAVRELVAGCRGAAHDIEQAESGDARYLGEAGQELRRLADKHGPQANGAVSDDDPATKNCRKQRRV